MAYWLGVDLGTTFTAAATWRDGRADVVSLGGRSPMIPSVISLRREGGVVVGEAAERRALTDPETVAREFKRRVGDPTPMILGGVPYSPDALMALLLRWVVDAVTSSEGESPAGVAVSFPANWGGFKQELLQQTIHRADLDSVVTITEPEAAAIYYASQERVDNGALVLVYDLGGGTFDAAVLRKADAGWEITGSPEGIEHLGGIDFDEAVFQYVNRMIAADAPLVETDPATRAALARLRQECVDAKETLSADTDVAIPVIVPGLHTTVRLTREEFEQMIGPPLAASLGAVERTLRSADIRPPEIDLVLLVGGSSRIPLVAQVVESALDRPVVVDAHPKYGVALGAAMVGAGSEASLSPAVALAGQTQAPEVSTEQTLATTPEESVEQVTTDADPPLVIAAVDPEPAAVRLASRKRRRRVVAAALVLGVVAGTLAVALAGGGESQLHEASTTRTTSPTTTGASTTTATTAVSTTTTTEATTSTSSDERTTTSLSKGVGVPNVTGQDENTARSALQGAGFTNIQTQREASDSVPAGRVIRTDPGAGAQVARSEPIVVIISTGASKVSVPAIEGFSEANARAALQQAGLRGSVQDQTVLNPAQDGVVITQSPSAGQQVDKGSTVTLFVGRLAETPGGGGA